LSKQTLPEMFSGSSIVDKFTKRKTDTREMYRLKLL